MEIPLLDRDLSHNHPECFTDPLGVTQLEGDPKHVAKERDQQRPDSHRARKFFSANRRRCLGMIYFLSIGPGLLFSGFFHVEYVRAFLCVPFLAMTAYFVCRLSFIGMPPDADNDEQFKSEEGGDFAPETALGNGNSAIHPCILTLCVSYVVVVLWLAIGPSWFLFFTNLFSPLCFAFYFLLTKSDDSGHAAAAERAPLGSDSHHRARTFFSANRRRCLGMIYFLSIGPGLFFSGFFHVEYVLCVPFLAMTAYFVCRLSFIDMPPDADNDEQFKSEEEGDFEPNTAVVDNGTSQFRPFILKMWACYILVVCITFIGYQRVFLLANILSPLCFGIYFLLTKPEARDHVASCELPRVGGAALENDRPKEDVLGEEQGRELAHSMSPPIKTSPLIVRGILVV